MPKPRPLPKRFRPYADQARTEADIRYSGQETGIRSLFDTTTRDYNRQAASQETAFRGLLGSLATAGVNLNRTYSDAGLTPEVRAQYAQTPDGQRILAQLARDQGAIQQQELGARSGQQFQQQRLAEDYRDDVGQINTSLLSLLKERGQFEGQALGGLIGEDRARRSAANADVRKQAYDAEQAILQRQSTMDNALIGQGLLPGEDGALQPLPGGKADPNAPGNKPKPKKMSGAAHESFQSKVNDIASWTKNWPNLSRSELVKKLRQGRETRSGWADKDGNPVAEGTPGAVPYTLEGIPRFKADLAMSAALDIALDGTIGRTTQQRIQRAGYSVRDLGIPSFGQRPTQRPTSRPRNAPSGTPGQYRPT